MIGQFLLTFREGLEAALIVTIILLYLRRAGYGAYSRFVWLGVALSVAASLLLGAGVWLAYGTIPKNAQTLFEGVAALTAVVVLSWMIHWMARKGRTLKQEVERRVEEAVTRGTAVGLVALTFVIVFREGLETVLFLTPFMVREVLPTVSGALLGIASSLTIPYLVFVTGKRLSLRRLFYYTSLLLALLASGLASYGTHELISYVVAVDSVDLGWLQAKAYDLAIPSGSPLHHEGLIGSVLFVLFGYMVSKEWLAVMVQAAYLAVYLPLIVREYERGRVEGDS